MGDSLAWHTGMIRLLKLTYERQGNAETFQLLCCKLGGHGTEYGMEGDISQREQVVGIPESRF